MHLCHFNLSYESRVTFVKEWDKIWQAVKHSQNVSVKRQGALRQDDAPAQVKTFSSSYKYRFKPDYAFYRLFSTYL
jgi:hypothetical protein